MAIHKSQGSEYPAVVIPVMTRHYTMLQRNLLYTGVTRGRKLVLLVGQKRARHRSSQRLRTATLVKAQGMAAACRANSAKLYFQPRGNFVAPAQLHHTRQEGHGCFGEKLPSQRTWYVFRPCPNPDLARPGGPEPRLAFVRG